LRAQLTSLRLVFDLLLSIAEQEELVPVRRRVNFDFSANVTMDARVGDAGISSDMTSHAIWELSTLLGRRRALANDGGVCHAAWYSDAWKEYAIVECLLFFERAKMVGITHLSGAFILNVRSRAALAPKVDGDGDGFLLNGEGAMDEVNVESARTDSRQAACRCTGQEFGVRMRPSRGDVV
jgi:hypothetical protein